MTTAVASRALDLCWWAARDTKLLIAAKLATWGMEVEIDWLKDAADPELSLDTLLLLLDPLELGIPSGLKQTNVWCLPLQFRHKYLG